MAGRIPDTFIQDLLARTDIVDVVRSRVELKKAGRDYSACCPFHHEKTPSFTVSPSKQFYYCFGCGCKGNAIGFLMEYESLGFPEAVDHLAGLAGLDVPREKETPQAKRERSINQQILDMLERAQRFYQNQMQAAPERQKVHHYLQQRGLSADICQQFGLGYAPPGFDNLKTGLALSAEQQELALTGGLLSENDNQQRYDKFRDRLIFPIRNSRGQIIGFGGRLLGDGKPKYLNSPETPVFHKGQELYGLWEWRQARQPDKALIVVEGYMDVISLAQFGIRNVVATLGTATSDKHLRKLFREVDEVIFCFDGDKAGRRAAWRALEATLGELTDDKQASFLFLEDGEDPDSLVRRQGPEAIRAAASHTQSLEDFLFQQLSLDLDTTQVAGRARLAHLALPYIARLKGDFYRNLLEKSLAERTGLDATELERLKTASLPSNNTSPPRDNTASMPAGAYVDDPAPPRRPHQTSGNLSLSERLLLLLVHYPQLAQEHPVSQLLDDVSLAGQELLQEALTALTDSPVSTSAQALGLFMALPHGKEMASLLKTRLGVSDRQIAAREWQGGLLQLQRMHLEKQIAQARQASPLDIKKLQALLQKHQSLKHALKTLDYRAE